MDQLKIHYLIPILAGLILGVPIVQAAEPTVRLVGPSGQVQTGTIFPVEIRIDTGGVNINAAELSIVVVGEGTEITRLDRAGSVFTLWPETPSTDSAVAHFVGGRPGGVVAVDALVGTIFVVARQSGTVRVSLLGTTSGFYRNDGLGTKVPIPTVATEIHVADDLLPGLRLSSVSHPTESDWGRTGEIDVSWGVRPDEQFSYRMANDISVVPDDDVDAEVNPLRFNGFDDGVWYFTIKRRLPGEAWSSVYQRRFQLDRTPPVPFSIEQLPPSSVNEKNLIIWSATDAISTATSSLRIGNHTFGTVSSPLLLDPNWAGKTLVITVADQAGNTRVAEWQYPGRVMWPWWWIAVGVILGCASGIFIARRIGRR